MKVDFAYGQTDIRTETFVIVESLSGLKRLKFLLNVLDLICMIFN